MKTFERNHMMTPTIPGGVSPTRVSRLAARVLVIASTAIVVTLSASRPQASSASDRCPLCAPGLDVPVTSLTAEALDSIARRHASFNAIQLARIDSVFRAGYYGPPDDKKARKRAHLMARLSTINAYRDLVRLACDPERVYEANEATLRDLYQRYSDVNLFVGVRLEHVRMGMGRVCMRYAVEEEGRGVVTLGGKQVPWRVKDVKIGGCRRRVLKLHFPTGEDDEVEILVAPHHTFKVEYTRSAGPPAPFEWFLVYDIEGAWLRKWGTHRPTAYMFWVSAPDVMASTHPASMGYAMAASSMVRMPGPVLDLPRTPLVGLRLYIQGLRLRMPLLPDINVDDLREIELPMPILELEYLRRNRQPSWLDVNDRLGFKGWKQSGPVPSEIRRRFPDL